MAQVTSSGPATSAAAATQWATILRHDLPVRTSATLESSVSYVDDPTPSNRTADALPMVRFPDPPADCSARSRLDPDDLRCGPFIAQGPDSNAAPTVSVGDADALGLLLGHAPSGAALAALARGDAVALRSDVASTGTATVDWFTPKQLMENGDLSQLQPRRTTRLAATVDLPEHPILDSLFVTPATAKDLGLPLQTDRILLTFTRPPTDVELDTVNQAFAGLANSPGGKFLSVEHGPQDYGTLIAWYTLLACLVIAISAGATAIGLARIDGRADDLTLASLGAAPRILRSVAFVQAVIICGVGAVIGTGLGLLPAVALGVATNSFPFAPPTLQLVLAAVGIPLVIAAGSWLLVGNRGDLTRREAIG
jgi:putative ABC transport system permease protein